MKRVGTGACIARTSLMETRMDCLSSWKWVRGCTRSLVSLQKTISEKKKVNYLQFMAHGHGAQIYVDKFEKRKRNSRMLSIL